MKNVNIIISVVVVLIIAGTVAAIPLITTEEGQNMLSGFTTAPATQESGDTGDVQAGDGAANSGGGSGGSSPSSNTGGSGGTGLSAQAKTKMMDYSKANNEAANTYIDGPYKQGNSYIVKIMSSSTGKSVGFLEFDANGNNIGGGGGAP